MQISDEVKRHFKYSSGQSEAAQDQLTDDLLLSYKKYDHEKFLQDVRNIEFKADKIDRGGSRGVRALLASNVIAQPIKFYQQAKVTRTLFRL